MRVPRLQYLYLPTAVYTQTHTHIHTHTHARTLNARVAHTQALFGKMVDKTPVPTAIDPDKPLTDAGRRRMIHQRRAVEEEKPSEASEFSKAFGVFLHHAHLLSVCLSDMICLS